MKVGIPHMGSNATKENTPQIALDAEKEGLDSIWVAERLLAFKATAQPVQKVVEMT